MHRIAYIVLFLFVVATCGLLPVFAESRGVARQAAGDFPVVITDPQNPIASIEILTDDGGRVDWSAELNQLAFDRRGADGYYDVYTMQPDGSNVQCLTCSNSDLPKKNKGNPVWHPSGGYIVFQAEKRFQIFSSYWSEPGRGFNNDLWISTADGGQAVKLRTVKRRMGVLHPHFSRDGSKLFWSEKTGSDTWALKLADVIGTGASAQLDNIATYTPGAGLFYESHDISEDGRTLLFSGNLDNQSMSGLDVYTLDIQSQTLTNLTASTDQWDEHAHYAPSGKKIVWMSSKDCNCTPAVLKDLRTDIWMMDSDGANKMRLTYFNEPGYPEYISDGIVAGDMSWSPDGRELAAYLIMPGTGLPETQGKIVRITFREPQ